MNLGMRRLWAVTVLLGSWLGSWGVSGCSVKAGLSGSSTAPSGTTPSGAPKASVSPVPATPAPATPAPVVATPPAVTENECAKIPALQIEQGGVAAYPFRFGDEDSRESQKIPETPANRSLNTTRISLVGVPKVHAAASVFLKDGKILVAGFVEPHNSYMTTGIFLVRLNPDGSADTSFGCGGVTETDLHPKNGGSVVSLSAMALLPDSRILLAGSFEARALLVRLSSDGHLDPQFGDRGSRLLDFGTSASFRDLRILADGANGKVMAVGGMDEFSGDKPHPSYLWVQMTPDGELDPGFGDRGVVKLAARHDHPISAAFTSFMPMGDGGWAFTANELLMPVRGTFKQVSALVGLEPDGSPIPDFGDKGRVDLPQSWGAAQVVEHSGTLTVVSTMGETLHDPGLSLFQFDTLGRLIAPFGKSGRVSNRFCSGEKESSMDFSAQLEVGEDGSILSARAIRIENGSYLGLVRWKDNGQPDSIFGRNGGLLLAPTELDGSTAYSVGTITGLRARAGGGFEAVGSSSSDADSTPEFLFVLRGTK